MDPLDGLNPQPNSTQASQSLSQLRDRWGVWLNIGKDIPDSIDVAGMSREMWLRIGEKNGEKTRYVLEREFRGEK